MVIRLIGAE